MIIGALLMHKNTVLVGDVGGTNVRFGLASRSGGQIKIDNFVKMPGDDFTTFEDALAEYLSETSVDLPNTSAIFALAGPPIDGRILLTNRDWIVDQKEILNRFNFANVELMNDFAAMSRAVPEIDKKHLIEIRSGTPQKDRPIIVTGPGTGLGVATLIPQNDDWIVVSGEGGYMAYAPQTETEQALQKELQKDVGYVFNELVCAGIGFEPTLKALSRIYHRPYIEITPAELLASAAAGDEMYIEFCKIRANCILSAAGDIVFANGGLGGVILAGGVTERLVNYLKQPEAIKRFETRGKNSRFIQTCPIHLMTDPVAPLIGAATFRI